MSSELTDCRLERADLGRRAIPAVPTASGPRCSPSPARWRSSLYFAWLLRPGRVGNPVLFGVLVAAELFNVAQALGFWWTCLAGGAGAAARTPQDRRSSTSTCSSRPTASRSRSSRRPSPRRRGCDGAEVHVALLDDGNREEMVELARRHGVRYVRRTLPPRRQGRQHQPRPRPHRRPYVLVLDCDHVPAPRPARSGTLPEFADAAVAYVQTPQYYANAALEPGRRRGVEPAGAVLRADRPRQGRPRRDVLLRHERRVPPRAPSRRSAGSRRAR